VKTLEKTIYRNENETGKEDDAVDKIRKKMR